MKDRISDLFRRDGAFLPVAATPEPETVAQLFRHKVLRRLLKKDAIAESVVRNLLAWPHTGFGTHVSRGDPTRCPHARSRLGFDAARAWGGSLAEMARTLGMRRRGYPQRP